MRIFSCLCSSIIKTMEYLSGENLVNYVISNNNVAIFSKTTCPFCKEVKSLMQSLNQPYFALELDKRPDGADIQQILIEKTNQRTVPNVFIRGRHMGGCSEVKAYHENCNLLRLLDGSPYEYDLVVIGGGSGGLAAAKEAAAAKRKVAVCDYVTPSPRGTSWGLGGTCVNVGCIPKKLMHRAALLGHDIKEAPSYGWSVPQGTHDWTKLVDEVQNYIKSLNFNARKDLRASNITYYNAFARFVDQHHLKMSDGATISAENFIIAVGGRPRYPDSPGAREFGITSDDIFSLKHHPGKTLIVGSSYIALECAGFLVGFGVDVTVMVRTGLLRAFDRQMAEMIGDHLESEGVKFIQRGILGEIEMIKDGSPPLLKVSMLSKGEHMTEEFNTVLFAIGRNACTSDIGLQSVGVELNEDTGKIIVDDYERTSVRNIYAIGDVIDEKPELTPVAIQAGKLLAQRLFLGTTTKMDYYNVPTTVFTPLEYGCVGLSEENAIDRYGSDNIDVYHTYYNPVDYALSRRDEGRPYIKLICLKSEENRVVGFHILGPFAGEITQGFALGLRLKAKLQDFHDLVGIHPTCAEVATTLTITKASGKNVDKSSC